MGKIDFMALKREREAQESTVQADIPEALEQSYTQVWGSDKETVEYIELNRIEPYSDSKGRTQPFHISEERVQQIKFSASDVGIITPLIVRKKGTVYQIISGHHRYMAAKELELLTVPCVVRSISDDEATKYVTESNIQRVKLTPTEYAEIYSRYMEMRSDIDMTVQEIADKFNISKKSLYRYIKILELTDELKELIDNDMINVDTAEIFCNFSTNNQDSVCEFVLNCNKKINRALAKEMEQIVKNYNGDKVPAHEFSCLLNKKKKACKNKLYNSFAEKYNVEYSEQEWNELVEKLLDKHFSE